MNIINITDFNFLGKSIYNILSNSNYNNHIIHELMLKINGNEKSLCFFIKEPNDIVNNIKEDDDILIDSNEVTSEMQLIIDDKDTEIKQLEEKIFEYRNILSMILNTSEVTDDDINKLVDLGLINKSFTPKFD